MTIPRISRRFAEKSRRVAVFGVLFAAALSAAAQDSRPAVATDSAAVVAAIASGRAYLLREQNEDGSWGGTRNITMTSSFANPATYECWKFATTGLVARSLLDTGNDAEGLAAAKRGLENLAKRPNLVRPADWDVDNVWGLIYGLDSVAHALRDPRIAESDLAPLLKSGGQQMVKALLRYQTPSGGWGYYADPESAWRPGWATSFTTSAGVLALLEAKAAGLEVPAKELRAAARIVKAARRPNGAFAYNIEAIPAHPRLESIDQVKGSLGRMQIGNLVLLRSGLEDSEATRIKALEEFFEHHKFLDAARNKPIPHEAYYANAAYFYLFGHYYAAEMLGTIGESERARFVEPLRAEILKCRQKDGAFWDFWIANNTKCYGTAFAIMALQMTLERPNE